jgi:glycine betaine transporter
MGDETISKQPVFTGSVIAILVLVFIGVAGPDAFGDVADIGLATITDLFGWFYLISVFGFLVVLLFLALGKYGSIRLGPQDSEPEFSFFSWVSMLLAAGFGVGLVFYGMAEPMSHFAEPPYGDREPGTIAAALYAIQYSFFNWGVHQWAAFAIVGLIIGYYQYRKGKTGLVSSVLAPVLRKLPGERYIGHGVDILAVVATVMGVATSLGLGVLQMSGGVNFVTGLPNTIWMQAAILAIMFMAYMISTWTGLEKGIQRLSNLNMLLCFALMGYFLVFGPTLAILETITVGLGSYLQNFIGMSLRTTPFSDDDGWASTWTVFYWAWVIAWSPFVGTFVARISRGRTIREYVFGVLVMPALLACLWIGVFGGTALHMELTQDIGLAAATQADITTALFQMFDNMAFTTVLSVVALVLIFTFLVTSADSASYILAQMSGGGDLDPPVARRILWGVLIASICFTLLLAGGLSALQSASVLAALPFLFILYAMVIVLLKELDDDHRSMLRELYERHDETPVGANVYEAQELDADSEAELQTEAHPS